MKSYLKSLLNNRYFCPTDNSKLSKIKNSKLGKFTERTKLINRKKNFKNKKKLVETQTRVECRRDVENRELSRKTS